MADSRAAMPGQLVRFALGSAFTLGVKLLLMRLALLVLAEVPAYALVQVGIFFIAYLVHTRFTFGTRPGRGGLLRYLRTIIVFLALDWLVFTVIFTRFGIDSLLVVLMSSGVVFLLRFVFVRRSLRRA